MEFLLDPNIAYLVLVVAILFLLIAIASPGTGVPEALGLMGIAAAGYAVYHLSLNWWALIVLVASIVPFYFSVRGPRREAWLALSILGLTIGSIFFFPARQGWISVNPVLAAVTSALFAALLWVSTRKVVQILQTQPKLELSTLIGECGETRTDVRDQGSVQVASELWSARSAKLIRAGRPVQVVGRDGFVLIVEERGS
jgi:membrane-bound serine protease (ClpP class)